jgi:catechol-2,3-dioxygenase
VTVAAKRLRGAVLSTLIVGAAGYVVLMIGRYEHAVIDCPEPRVLADFYMRLLGMQVERESDSWVVIRDAADRHRLAFQRVPHLRRPRWPDPERPQQFHIDVMVADIERAEAEVLKIGASRLPYEGPDFRVYEDPAGHPFCLCWA